MGCKYFNSVKTWENEVHHLLPYLILSFIIQEHRKNHIRKSPKARSPYLVLLTFSNFASFLLGLSKQ